MDMMASLRSQMEALDAKIVELQQSVTQDDEDMTPIDLDIDDMMTEVLPEPEPEVDDLPDDDLPFDDLPEPEEAVAEPVAEPEPPVESEPEVEPVMEPETIMEPVAEPAVEAVMDAVEPKVAVIDSMTDRQAWRTDMPGSPVRDIRSAISLNDRILFINSLFAQDPMAFQETLTRINQMESLDEVVAYVVAERPDWNLESETVYRFMMAVRRKIQK